MNKNQQVKAEKVEEIKELFNKSQSVVVVDYRGLSVEQDTELRRQLRQGGVEYKVLKNTLVKRAVDDIGIEGLDEYLKGPTALAFGISDPVSPAKIFGEYIGKANLMSVKTGIIDGKLIGPEGVKALAALPSREVLIATVLGTLNAPVTGLVTVLGGTLRSLLYTLNAIGEQRSA